MKTAIIYTGQARTFEQVIANQYWHVLRKFPDPQFFVSIENDDQAGDMEKLYGYFPAERVHIQYVSQPQIPEPRLDPQWLAMYPPSSPPQAILRQLWALREGWRLAYSLTQRWDDTIVVRLRPDLAFYRFDPPQFESVKANDCLTPWWARWGGVNDRFAIMGFKAAWHYFNTFEKLTQLGAENCPLHPETLVAASLEFGGVNSLPTLGTEFATIRLDGSVVAPSITVIDEVEYARSTTHRPTA